MSESRKRPGKGQAIPEQKASSTDSSTDRPKSQASSSPLFFVLVVILAIGLGFLLGLSFFPVLVDSPRFVGRDANNVKQEAPVKEAAPPSSESESVKEAPSSSGSESVKKAPASESASQAKRAAVNKEEPEPRNTDRLFTKEELRKHDGSDEKLPIYLAIMGKVFDVTKGRKHYGKDGGYSFFAGRDATRAFVSGNFTEGGLIEDVTGLEDLLGIEEWISFYRKDYKYAGKLIGHFYDENGKATDALKQYKKDLIKAKDKKLDEEAERRIFPPCNSHWAQGKGGTVWCSDESGGIKRDWVGVPRRLFKPGTDSWRCVCVRTKGAPSIGKDNYNHVGDLEHPNLALFKDCQPMSVQCPIPDES